jgi:uncharacterized membrane protein YkvA (DUF1232 family)
MDEHDPRLMHYFEPFMARAKALAAAPDELPALASRAQRKLNTSPDPYIANVRNRADRIARYVKAQAATSTGDRSEAEADALELAVASIVYFLSPTDQIPDAQPAGQIDDAAVFAFVARTLADELDRALGTDAN